MKILSFGHIPVWAGGRQSSGLANVIYQLAKHMSHCKDVELTLAATDVYKPLVLDEQLTVVGWSKGVLVRYAFIHPFLSIKWLIVVLLSRIKYGQNIFVPGFFFKGLHLLRCLNLVNPDVVHLHGMNACIYDSLIPPNVKIVVTMHGLIGTDNTIMNQANYMKLEQKVCKSTRYLFVAFIARKLKDDFSTLYHGIQSLSVVIPNAYDKNMFYYEEPIKHKKLTFVTVASLSNNKGQHRVIEAIAKSGIDCKYICIGAGTKSLILQNEILAKQYGVDYEYVGKKTPSEIRKYMTLSDYMILPSSTEGFGLVYLESIACGVPVILPKHLPIVKESDIIKPGINALLLENCSSDAIVEILKIINRYQFNHLDVSQSISGYTWNGIAQQYIDTINNCL